jgi:hypothetical protein
MMWRNRRDARMAVEMGFREAGCHTIPNPVQGVVRVSEDMYRPLTCSTAFSLRHAGRGLCSGGTARLNRSSAHYTGWVLHDCTTVRLHAFARLQDCTTA